MQTSPIVPDAIKGKQTDLDHSITADTREEAVLAFERARRRLRTPSAWHALAGMLSGQFALTDHDGTVIKRPAQLHDHLRVTIPGPGTAAGHGHDWVTIVGMTDEPCHECEQERFGYTVRPCADPRDKGKDVAHFFDSSATSSFIVERDGNKVTASYYGRNEQPNTDTKTTGDNIRNAIVATGAMAGLSEAQWNALMKGLLED